MKIFSTLDQYQYQMNDKKLNIMIFDDNIQFINSRSQYLKEE
jgi:hypothetical protein